MVAEASVPRRRRKGGGPSGRRRGLAAGLQEASAYPLTSRGVEEALRRVMIEKPGGGERPLGIPTIRDRVAQTAAKLILDPIFEADG